MLAAGMAEAQDYGNRLGRQRGGAVSFEPRGPGVLFGGTRSSHQEMVHSPRAFQ